MDEEASFGRWLKLRRRALDLTQRELGLRVGCAEGTIRKLEAEILRPSKQIAERLAAQCGVPPEQRAAFVAFARGKGDALAAALDIKEGPLPSPTRAGGQGWAGSLRPITAAAPPVPLTPLIGREGDIALVTQILQRGEVHLLTLLGPPGVGKTRLSMQVAAELRPSFSDGTWFVPLAPVSDPGLVPATIARALGVPEADSQPLDARLQAFLCDKQLLLILDNVEQVVSAAAFIARLLAAAPRLKVLITSRAALRISAEHAYVVAPLALPDLAALPPPETLLECPAVAMFCRRAQAVRAKFRLTPEIAPAVAAICVRLDGLPLAIELAAAHVKLLSPPALLHRLDRRLKLLTRGARDLPAHQQTLRDAIAWSYELLAPKLQALFACMGVFVEGCTIEAAEEVCKAEGDAGDVVLDGIATLLDHSLLCQTEQGGEVRITMLETIREYALERLHILGLEERLRRRHASYYLALAQREEREVLGPGQRYSLDRIVLEHNNLRAALAWSQATEGAADTGLRIAGALWWSWWARGYASEGRRWLEGLLASSNERTVMRAKALYAAGALAYFAGDFVAAQARLGAARTIYAELDDRSGRAHTQIVLGALIAFSGEPAAGHALVAESAALFRQGGAADWWGLGLALINMRVFTIFAGDYETARAQSEEALAVFRALGQPYGISLALNGLGDVARVQHDYVAAAAWYEESLALLRESSVMSELPALLHNLGYVALAQGLVQKAKALFAEALATHHEAENMAGVAECLTGYAGVAAVVGQPQQAARLFGIVDSLRAGADGPIWPPEQVEYERHLAAARAQLDEAAFTVAWRAGHALPLREAIAEALTPPSATSTRATA
jgi:predicted ATPase/transcriptional regulator with XRE-family HTH domain